MGNWTLYQQGILKRLYATAPQEDIIEALGGEFGWKAIRIQASRMGLIRYGYGGTKGESKYSDDHVYCPHCEKFMHRDNSEKGYCKVCHNRVRDPGEVKRSRSK